MVMTMMMVIGLVDYGETCNDCDGDDGGGDHVDYGSNDDDDLDGDQLLLLLLSTSPTQLQHIPLQTAQLCLKS